MRALILVIGTGVMCQAFAGEPDNITNVPGRQISEEQALALIRKTPEFQEFVQWAKRNHFKYTVESDLRTDSSEVPESVVVPSWCVEVRTIVIDNRDTGEGHGTLSYLFFVKADSGQIFVRDFFEDHEDFPTIEEWRKRHDKHKKP